MDDKKLKFIMPFILWSIIAFLLIFRLDQVPKLWWDEGWTLSVARNWVENDHFGLYLENEPIPPRIPVRFPVVWPIVLSFKLLGIGIFQGRLPGVIFTFLTLIVLFYLSSHIYNKKVAYASIVLIIFLSGGNFNPILIGRQVFAEMPMLFYLLSGYLSFWFAINKSVYWVIPTSLFWGVAFISKIQVPPFFSVSMTLMALMLLLLKQWNKLRILFITLIGTLCVISILVIIQNKFVPSLIADKPLLDLLINSITMVFIWPVRKNAMINVLVFGFPLTISYLYFIISFTNFLKEATFLDSVSIFRRTKSFKLTNFEVPNVIINQELLRIGLWGLGFSWFVWYLFLSMDWHRYLFPAYFIGSIFTSFLLYKVTNHFDMRVTVLNTSSLFLYRQINFVNFLSFFGILIIGVGVCLSSVQIYPLLRYQIISMDPIESYIENNIPDKAVIETFESELFFIAPHNYHFPSDLVSMQLVRRLTIAPNFIVDYDPIIYNPDYLIVGDYSKLWKLYDRALDEEQFSLEIKLPGYDIYRRSQKNE